MSLRIAYIMSRFPKLTETFILYEMLAMEKRHVDIEVYPLIRQQEPITHEEAQRFVRQANYAKPFSSQVIKSNLSQLVSQPGRYLQTWARVLWGNRTSAKFLTRAVIALLLATYFANDMKKKGVDHIHAHWATHATLAAWIIRQLVGIPYSFTAHAHDIFVERAMLDQKLIDASFAVTISDYNRAFLQELYGPQAVSQLKVIHCGVDTGLFKPAATADAASTPQLVCIGRLEKKKGQRYLIEACSLLKEAGIAFRCLIIGEGDEREQLTELIQARHLAQDVFLAGQKPRHEILEILQQASIVIQPSIVLPNGKQEGIPVALMEALAMGLPVVASDISGVPELIQDGKTGRLVPERDSQALANAIQELLQEPALARSLGQAGRQIVKEEFDLEKNAAELLDHIRGSLAISPDYPVATDSSMSTITTGGDRT